MVRVSVEATHYRLRCSHSKSEHTDLPVGFFLCGHVQHTFSHSVVRIKGLIVHLEEWREGSEHLMHIFRTTEVPV